MYDILTDPLICEIVYAGIHLDDLAFICTEFTVQSLLDNIIYQLAYF